MHTCHTTSRKARLSLTCSPLALIAAVTVGLALLSTDAMAEEGTISSDGVAIHFADEGAGETVVFLHSFAGSSKLWPASGLMPLDGFRTIAIDARGHGDSGKPESVDAYGMEMIEDVVAVMDARGVASAHVVGYSMGAETALKLAVTHPDRVSSLVVAGSGWSGEEEAGLYGFIAGALSEVDSFGDFMAAMSPPEEELPPEAAEAMGALIAAHGMDPAQAAAPLAAVSASLSEIISLDTTELATIEVPVLGIAGSEDPESGNVAKLAEALPEFTFVSIEGADHLAAPLTPEFAAAVTSFLGD